MSNYNYKSAFKDDIKNFIEDKRASGNKYDTHKYILKSFDMFCIKENATLFSTGLITKWLNSNSSHSKQYIFTRAILINQLAIVMNKNDKQVPLLDLKAYKCKNNFIPHIYTDQEINIFFTNLKTIENTKYYPHKNIMFQLLFKLAYCCGLRIGEVINIKVKDTKLKNNMIYIESSKNIIDRFVYVDDNIMDTINKITLLTDAKNDDYLFCDPNFIKVRYTGILETFRKIWQKAGIDSKKLNFRIHDFRHSMACHNLKNWYLEGKDLYSCLPILMTYMGHSNLISTEYYLRIIPEVFPNIIQNYQNKYKNILPVFEGDFDE